MVLWQRTLNPVLWFVVVSWAGRTTMIAITWGTLKDHMYIHRRQGTQHCAHSAKLFLVQINSTTQASQLERLTDTRRLRVPLQSAGKSIQ